MELTSNFNECRTKSEYSIPFAEVEKLSPSTVELVARKSHDVVVPREQSSSQGQVFHLTVSFPSCQIRDNEFPEAVWHHPLPNKGVKTTTEKFTK